jgi:plastocyanin
MAAGIFFAGTPLAHAQPAGAVQGRVSGGSLAGRVISVEGVPGHFPAPKQHAVMDQKGLRFVPHVLAVLVGTVVDFPNSDPLLHNVFSFSQPKRFNLGLYPKGQSPSVLFDKPGVVAVLCSVHPEMSGYIIVLSHPFFAVTGTDGRFTIRDVPAGSYTVRCWSENGKLEERKVTINAGGIETIAF